MTARITLPNTDLSVFPICLGGNVFGWSADEQQSHIVLAAALDAGANFVDTADVYSQWAPGHEGGESETVIGNFLAKRGSGARDEMVIATKVAMSNKRPGLKADNIAAAAEDSLRRLQTDHIDLYYAHQDDPETPLEETLVAFDKLIKAGKVRYIAASNYSADRLREANRISEELGISRYIALQNRYNLVDREEYETQVAPTVAELGLSTIPYYGLGVGFLTGKYRKDGDNPETLRSAGAARYFTDLGWRSLAMVEQIALDRSVSMSSVALAWLAAQPTVSTPIASARNVAQLHELTQLVSLTAAEVEQLDAASQY